MQNVKMQPFDQVLENPLSASALECFQVQRPLEAATVLYQCYSGRKKCGCAVMGAVYVVWHESWLSWSVCDAQAVGNRLCCMLSPLMVCAMLWWCLCTGIISCVKPAMIRHAQSPSTLCVSHSANAKLMVRVLGRHTRAN